MYGVPLGSKVCIFSGTKNNISGTKNNISGTKNNFSGTKNNFSPTKINFSGTKIHFSPTNIIFSPTKIILVPLKLILVPLKIQTFEPIGTPQNGKQRCAYFNSANQSRCYKRHAIAPVPCKKASPGRI